jgi:hypothetical protein
MRLVKTLVCAVPFLAVSQPANAQRINQIETGVRIRVTSTHRSALVGAFIGADSDSIRLMTDGSNQTVRSAPRTDISKIEVSRGRSRAKGALIKGLIGLGIGAASGAILGAATYSDGRASSCTSNFGCGEDWCIIVCSKSQAAAFVGVFGGAAGLVIGSIAGAVSGEEQWNNATLR